MQTRKGFSACVGFILKIAPVSLVYLLPNYYSLLYTPKIINH